MAADESPEEGGDDTVLVRVEPSRISVRVRRGETLMAAAERQGYRWPTVCHGQGICTACHVVLPEDTGAFEPPGPVELTGLAQFAGRSFYEGKIVRLACQARPVGDATVVKRGVKPRS